MPHHSLSTPPPAPLNPPPFDTILNLSIDLSPKNRLSHFPNPTAPHRHHIPLSVVSPAGQTACAAQLHPTAPLPPSLSSQQILTFLYDNNASLSSNTSPSIHYCPLFLCLPFAVSSSSQSADRGADRLSAVSPAATSETSRLIPILLIPLHLQLLESTNDIDNNQTPPSETTPEKLKNTVSIFPSPHHPPFLNPLLPLILNIPETSLYPLTPDTSDLSTLPSTLAQLSHNLSQLIQQPHSFSTSHVITRLPHTHSHIYHDVLSHPNPQQHPLIQHIWHPKKNTSNYIPADPSSPSFVNSFNWTHFYEHHAISSPLDPFQANIVQELTPLTIPASTISGPPGTGKSHTISALISAKLAQGQRILFISQKYSALNVILQRLTESGLQHLALPLHAKNQTTSRKDLFSQFSIPPSSPPLAIQPALTQLTKLQQALSPFSCLSHDFATPLWHTITHLSHIHHIFNSSPSQISHTPSSTSSTLLLPTPTEHPHTDTNSIPTSISHLETLQQPLSSTLQQLTQLPSNTPITPTSALLYLLESTPPLDTDTSQLPQLTQLTLHALSLTSPQDYNYSFDPNPPAALKSTTDPLLIGASPPQPHLILQYLSNPAYSPQSFQSLHHSLSNLHQTFATESPTPPTDTYPLSPLLPILQTLPTPLYQSTAHTLNLIIELSINHPPTLQSLLQLIPQLHHTHQHITNTNLWISHSILSINTDTSTPFPAHILPLILNPAHLSILNPDSPLSTQTTLQTLELYSSLLQLIDPQLFSLFFPPHVPTSFHPKLLLPLHQTLSWLQQQPPQCPVINLSLLHHTHLLPTLQSLLHSYQALLTQQETLESKFNLNQDDQTSAAILQAYQKLSQHSKILKYFSPSWWHTLKLHDKIATPSHLRTNPSPLQKEELLLLVGQFLQSANSFLDQFFHPSLSAINSHYEPHDLPNIISQLSWLHQTPSFLKHPANSSNSPNSLNPLLPHILSNAPQLLQFNPSPLLQLHNILYPKNPTHQIITPTDNIFSPDHANALEHAILELSNLSHLLPLLAPLPDNTPLSNILQASETYSQNSHQLPTLSIPLQSPLNPHPTSNPPNSKLHHHLLQLQQTLPLLCPHALQRLLSTLQQLTSNNPNFPNFHAPSISLTHSLTQLSHLLPHTQSLLSNPSSSSLQSLHSYILQLHLQLQTLPLLTPTPITIPTHIHHLPLPTALLLTPHLHHLQSLIPQLQPLLNSTPMQRHALLPKILQSLQALHLNILQNRHFQLLHSHFQSVTNLLEEHPDLSLTLQSIDLLINPKLSKQAPTTLPKSIPAFFHSLPHFIQTLKPLIMASPDSLPHLLPHHLYQFDSLIIDEASQLHSSHTLHALLRTKQIIVVGDVHQLQPPSPHPLNPSILQLLLNLPHIPHFSLLCHYRSLHPSLISSSNSLCYNNSLIPIPSPNQKHPPPTLTTSPSSPFNTDSLTDHNSPSRITTPPPPLGTHTIQLTNSSYSNATNYPEAQYTINLASTLMTLHPHLSIGIVSTTTAQTTLLNQLLNFARISSLPVRNYLQYHQNRPRPEPLFIKTIDQIQGDERDIILISLAFSPPAPNTPLKPSLGPLSLPDSHNRLNVALSRSRYSTILLHSFPLSALSPSNHHHNQLLHILSTHTSKYSQSSTSSIPPLSPNPIPALSVSSHPLHPLSTYSQHPSSPSAFKLSPPLGAPPFHISTVSYPTQPSSAQPQSLKPILLDYHHLHPFQWISSTLLSNAGWDTSNTPHDLTILHSLLHSPLALNQQNQPQYNPAPPPTP